MMQPTVQSHLTRLPNDNLQQLFSTNSNFKKFTRRHSEKIKENNYSNNTSRNSNNTTTTNINNSNAKNAPANRRTLLPLVLPNQTDSDQIILLNNNTTAATQSLFNLTKFEPANLDQIKLIFKDIESLKMPRNFLLNNKNDNNISSSSAKSKIEPLDVDNDKLLTSQTINNNTSSSNIQTSTLTSAQAKETLFKFKKNSKCKKQIKKAKLNSDGDSSVTSSNSSSLAPNANAATSTTTTTSTNTTTTTTKIATPTASIRSSSSSSSSSILFSSSSSPSSLSSPSAVSSQSQPFFVTSDHCQQQHQQQQQLTHHNQPNHPKHHHVHRHQNYKCQNFDSGESVNDTDSNAVPITLIRANKKNDKDNNEDEEEDDTDETAPCLKQKTFKFDPPKRVLILDKILVKNESSSDNINSIDRDLCLINNDKAKIVEEEETDDIELSTNDNSTIRIMKTRASSPPNLMEIQNEEEPLLYTEKLNNNLVHNVDSKYMSNSNLTKSKIFNNTKATHSFNTDNSTSFNTFNSILINNAFNNCFTNLVVNKKFTQRYKLLTEGDLQVCKLQHSRNVLSKLLNSKLLRRWKAHRIILTDTEIYSTTVRIRAFF